MKLPCKVIEDLLPMYFDKVCSDESTALIEKHLQDCPHCSRILSDLRTDINIPKKEVDDTKPLIKIQKNYKKMRTRWLIIIAVILTLIPIAFFVGNDYSKQVIEYSEEEAVAYTNTFMTALTEGDYKKAFSCWDIESKKHEWLRGGDFKEDDLLNLEAEGSKKFCELGQSKVEAMGGIESYEFVSIFDNGYDYRGNQAYSVHYIVKFDGKDETFYVKVTENGIYAIGAADGYLKHPLVQFCIWGQWLYDDYLGRYYDYDLGQYVYYEN